VCCPPAYSEARPSKVISGPVGHAARDDEGDEGDEDEGGREGAPSICLHFWREEQFGYSPRAVVVPVAPGAGRSASPSKKNRLQSTPPQERLFLRRRNNFKSIDPFPVTPSPLPGGDRIESKRVSKERKKPSALFFCPHFACRWCTLFHVCIFKILQKAPEREAFIIWPSLSSDFAANFPSEIDGWREI